MAKVKVTFANGVVLVYDTELHAHPTGYGDENGVTHAVTSVESAPDDAEVGFTPPAAEPVADKPPAADLDARQKLIASLEADTHRPISEIVAEAEAKAVSESGDFVPSG